MFDVRGKRVIITGGAQGLGKEFARRLLQEGCLVCISDVDVAKGCETVNLFQKQFGCSDNGLCFVKCDVSQKEEWSQLWDNAVKMLGGPVDILVNNAGLHPGHGWEKNIAVNLIGVANGVFTAIERMGRSHGGNGGRIVNIASVASITVGGMGIIEHAGYNMSKHGVLALTKAFPHSEPAVYDSEGIKCYGLAPWFTDTNLVRESTIGSWDYRGKRVDSMQALQEATKLRVLSPTEVGHALLKAFQYDKDGTLYAIMPDAPLIEYPANKTLEFAIIARLAMKVGASLNIELFTVKHVLVILLVAMLILYHGFLCLLSFIF